MPTLQIDRTNYSDYQHGPPDANRKPRLLSNQQTLHNVIDMGFRMHAPLCDFVTLLSSKRDFKKRDLGYALMSACKFGRADVVQMLMQRRDVDISVTNMTAKHGQSPLHMACKKGHAAVVAELLRSNKVKLNLKNSKSSTPLFEAVNHDHAHVVRLMVQRRGVAVNSVNQLRLPALCIAICHGYVGCFEALLTRADLNVGRWDPEEECYLAGTFVQNRLGFSRQILRHKNMRINEQTPIIIAAREGHEFVSLILRNFSRPLRRVYLFGERYEMTRGRRAVWRKRSYRGVGGVRRFRL